MGAIYRLLDRDGVVLYVGSTTRENVARRWAEHFQFQPWSTEIRACEIVLNDVPDEMLLDAEAAISTVNCPKYGNWAIEPQRETRRARTPRPLPDVSTPRLRSEIDHEALAAWMDTRGVTPTELAQAVDVSLSYICDIRAGRVRLVRNAILRRRIAETLRVHPRFIEKNTKAVA